MNWPVNRVTAMKYYLMLRSRPRAHDSIPEYHDWILSQLSELPPPWSVTRKPWPKAADPGNNYSRTVTLRNFFGKTIVMTTSYFHRAAVRDQAAFRDYGSADDYFTFEFNVHKVDYALLLDLALPRFIEVTHAYRAQLMPHDYVLHEAGNIGQLDFRSAVYNIAPVNFFDRELCERAFRLSPEQLLDQFVGKIAEGRILKDGAYIIATREIVDEDHARQLAARFRTA
jgi:hypothetical protein